MELCFLVFYRDAGRRRLGEARVFPMVKEKTVGGLSHAFQIGLASCAKSASRTVGLGSLRRKPRAGHARGSRLI